VAFADRHWGVEPLVRLSGDPKGFDDLLSYDDVDHIVSSTSVRTPAFRLVKAGKGLPLSSYTRTTRTGSHRISGVGDPAAIYREFEAGATIVLQGLHRYWLPLARFCRDLELALGHPTQVNAYITPPGSQGLAVHSDEHDVFVLQVHGTKRWQVFRPSPQLPSSDPPVVEQELRAGECLYIPKGFPHAASTQDLASAHLTVGILSYAWADMIREVTKQAEAEPEFTEPLPIRFAEDPERLRTLAEDRLRSFAVWLEKQDPGEAADRLARRFLTGRRPILVGQLNQLERLDSLGDSTRVRRRPGTMCVIRSAGEGLSALLGDRELRMPAWVRPGLEFLADGAPVTVGALEPHLDEESRLVLVRRLVREGLLEVID
jgi:bifunctional lysine-specific demethylase and histidyl-hydroxylase NO66